ncbi:MAG: hypothetical protein Q9198_001109 [Flavoplaca austrocitrina]
MRLLHDYLRKRRQWAALRELRTKFASRNQHLMDLISRSNQPALKYSLPDYENLTDMLDTGILTFDGILLGSSPRSLKEVVAFLNLSYSAAIVMRRRGMPTSFSPSAQDFGLWRTAVPEPHRPQFDMLVQLMHPEIQQR